MEVVGGVVFVVVDMPVGSGKVEISLTSSLHRLSKQWQTSASWSYPLPFMCPYAQTYPGS